MHKIIIMQPSIAYLLMDRIESMLNPQIHEIEGLHDQIFKDIVGEYLRLEAERIQECCRRAAASGAKDFTIHFTYPETNEKRMHL